MPLSTSSSEGGVFTEEAPAARLPHGLRLTAADRPGVAQPVPERDVPAQPWRPISIAVLVLVVLFTSMWEWKMRSLGLVAGDIGDDMGPWPSLRRQVDQHNVPVAIVGDSRIFLGTDLDRVRQLTGIRPLQLGLTGTSGLPILENLADDPNFKGLAIVGMADPIYFGKPLINKAEKSIDAAHWESPSKRISFLIYRQLTHYVAMLDPNYQLSVLVVRLDPPWRAGARGPAADVWKIDEQHDDGQNQLWRRLEYDKRLSSHAIEVWHAVMHLPLVDKNSLADTTKRTKVAVDKIRARGGDVVFVRPPDAPALRELEDQQVPREKGWDPLLAYTHTKGVHADDLLAAKGLVIPEESHLSRACATVFTDAYIRRIAQATPLLPLRADAPPPLSPADCIPPAGR